MDDILCIHHNVDSALKWLHRFFLLMVGFGNGDVYYGVKLSKTRLHNTVWVGNESHETYLRGSQKRHGPFSC